MRVMRRHVAVIGAAVAMGGPLFGAANLRGELASAEIGAETDEQNAPVWIQIARTGKWMGHPDHPKGVEFTRQTFEQVIANFRRHPAFKLGANGLGVGKVVPFDYEHASEMHPTSGSIPTRGAPSPAWGLDLQLRDGADGEAELWSLTDLGAQAREQIRNDEYLWTSVSIWPAARDRVTNKPIGAVLTSVAFTNHPFIQGMAPMVAASDPRGVHASVSVWGKAETVDELIMGLRDIFGLPAEADAAAVTAELDELERLTDAGAEVPGVELQYLVDSVRRLVGLRTLAPRSELFEAARAALAGGTQTPGEATPPAQTENDMKLTSTLAQILKCRDSDDAILAAAKEVAEKGNAIDQLLALFQSKDLDGLVAEATKSVAAAAKVGPLLESLKAFRETLGKNADAEAEVEADAVVNSMKLDEATAKRIRPAIMAQRKACMKRTADGLFDGVDDAALTKFRADYPLSDEERSHLKMSIFANGSTQLALRDDGKGNLTSHRVPASSEVPVSMRGGQSPSGAPGTRAPGGHLVERVKLVEGHTGPNPTAKAVQYLCGKLPAFKSLDYGDQVRAAGRFLRGEVEEAQAAG